jgi:uncharacterized membrane protein HdeD (DUF308 family)
VERIFVRSWRALALRGIVSIAFGVGALIGPQIMLTTLVLVFGAYALLDGFLALAAATKPDASTRVSLLTAEAFFGIGVGMAALLWTQMSMLILAALIGVWTLVTGTLELSLAVRLRGKIPGNALLVLAGATSSVVGVVLVLWPRMSALAIVILVGSYALIEGTTMLALALRLRQEFSLPRQVRTTLRLQSP